jgi:glutamyl-Q tRNA(Asp) synthetase
VNGTAARLPSRYRGRFAPSPTGPLHFGSLVAALASYCDAAPRGMAPAHRRRGRPRSRPEAETTILTTLERYGFTWDGKVVRQSERTVLYAAALAQLAARGLAYECACTRRELECSPPGTGGERVYPGTCSAGIPADRSDRPQRAWRVRVGGGIIEYRDRLQGACTQDLAREVGDFVLRRADGLFAYQLAVVVDDAAEGITHVVRGADLLASTPRQIFLQQLLVYPTPSYLHVPSPSMPPAKSSPSRRARKRCATTRRCQRCLAPGAFWINPARAEAARPGRWANSGRGRLRCGAPDDCRRCRCCPRRSRPRRSCATAYNCRSPAWAPRPRLR